MILDTLINSGKYIGLHKNFEKAFMYIKNQNLEEQIPGKYLIDNEELFANVSLIEGLDLNHAKSEAHKKYIDIQYCISGIETMGWKSLDDCKNPSEGYNNERDVTFYEDRPDTYFELNPGQFVVFFPEDMHAPMIGKGLIKKLVIKVKV